MLLFTLFKPQSKAPTPYSNKSCPCNHLCQETVAPEVNPCRPMENILTPQRGSGPQGLNPGQWQCYGLVTAMLIHGSKYKVKE